MIFLTMKMVPLLFLLINQVMNDNLPPPPPFINQSNMNGSEVFYNLETARQLTINLTCYVEGSPKPPLLWFKDDQNIDEENDTYQFFEGKQLLMITHPDKTCSGLYRCLIEDSDEVSLKIVITEGLLEWPIIAEIAVAIVVCIILGIVGVIVYWRKKHQRKTIPADLLTARNYGIFSCKSVEKDSMEFWQLLLIWEFPRDKLKLEGQIGISQFRQVMRARAREISQPDTNTVVAMKMARKHAGPLAAIPLASEFRVLCHLSKHLNIVNLLGIVRNVNKSLLLIVEFCPYGNLEQYLKKCRANFFNPTDIDATSDKQFTCARLKNKSDINGRNTRRDYAYSCIVQHSTAAQDTEDATKTVIIDPDCPPNLHRDYAREIILTEDLLIWAYQTALGMDYVSRMKVVHGDLAARNILLADNNVVKIGAFGSAKNLYHTDCYCKSEESPMPDVRWMAMESIRDRIFSIQSDVWSYGVLLWEIFTLADSPFRGFVEPQKLYDHLSTGHRLEKPKYMTDDIYKIMCQCWEADPKLRPTFSQLVESIGNMLPEHVTKYFVDLNDSYTLSEKVQDGNCRAAGEEQSLNACSENKIAADTPLNAEAEHTKHQDSVSVHSGDKMMPADPEHPDSTLNCCKQPKSNFVNPKFAKNIIYTKNPNYKSIDNTTEEK